jgi:hypothetical protein
MNIFLAFLPEGMNIFGGGGGIEGALQTFKNILIGIIIFVVVSGGVGLFVWKKIQGRKFNIPLIIITPRSDGKVVEINKGLGGYFKSQKIGGITSFRIKRKGIGIVEIPPPPSSYLSSPDRTLLLAQKGVDDYEPVMPNELAYVETDAGEVVPILKLRAINQDATAWSFDNAETAKRRFTFLSLWEKYQVMITLMIFIFILFLVLYINWIGMKDVVVGLADIAKELKSPSIPIITPGG